MLSTPSTSHVDYNRVYEPAEDSFLLLDTLSSPSESAFLAQRFADTPAPLIVELGPGSGVVLAFITAHTRALLGRRDVLMLGVDISAFACKATAETVAKAVEASEHDAAGGAAAQPAHGVFVDVLNGDLATALRHSEVDVLVFNPPYVPAPLPDFARHSSYNDGAGPATFEQESHLLELSYAGGVDGMEITEKLLGQLRGVLSARGVAYILLCAQNKPLSVAERIQQWGAGWRADIVGTSGKTAGFEKLVVLRVWR